jgi:hypothetical protein
MSVNALMPGCAAGLYLNAAAGNTAYNSPTWLEVTDVKDVKVTLPWDFAESRSRDTPLKLYAKTGQDLSHQIVMRADPADATFQLFIQVAGTRAGVNAIRDLLILDAKQTVIGAVGVRGPFLLSIGDAPQDIDGMIYYTFDLKPTVDLYSNLPVLALVSNNNNNAVVTYTSITY